MVVLANELAARSVAVDLVAFTSEGPFRASISEPVRLVDLGTRRARASLWAMARYLKRARPAAVLTSQGHTAWVAVAARALIRSPTRIVVREENTFSASARSLQGRPAGRWVPRAVRWAYARADQLVAVSSGAADDLAAGLRLPADRIEVVANPLAVPDLDARAAEPLDDPWFAPGEPPVVLGAGRLRPAKDFGNLLQAFARVVRERPARLVVLGEGPERPELERLAAELGVQDAVRLPGFVTNPFAYMRRSAVFVLSSRWEGLPGALIEAMACGCPVVSTDCKSGPREILEDGRYGPLVPVGDADALARAVLQVLRDPPAREALAASAARYGLARIADRYVELLLGGPQATSA